MSTEIIPLRVRCNQQRFKVYGKYIIKNNKHYVIVSPFAKYAEISENDIDNFLDLQVTTCLF